MQESFANRIINRLATKSGIAFIIVAILLAILSQYGFLSVKVSSSSSQDITYKLKHTGSGKTYDFKGGLSSTKFVKRGTYEVLAKSSDHESFYKTSSVIGFLLPSSVNGTLVREKYREYIGNNPAGCRLYNSDMLYSYNCQNNSSIIAHNPATEDLPTYNTVLSSKLGIISNSFRTREGLLVFAQEPVPEDGTRVSKMVYVMGSNLSTTNQAALKELSSFVAYNYSPYKDGFIAYDSVLSSIYYYSSVGAKATVIKMSRPKDKDLRPGLVASRGDLIVALYDKVTSSTTDASTEISTPGKSVTKKIVISQGTYEYTINYNSMVSSLSICGQNYLCIGSSSKSNKLDIYELRSGKKMKLKMTLAGALSTVSNGNRLIVLKSDGIYYLDPATNSGYLDLSLGDFGTCGINPVSDEYYLACLRNNKGVNVVLKIDNNRDDADSIDKKVEELQTLKELKGVSIYGKYIFISADLGRADYYDEEIKSYSYSPTVKAKVAPIIDAKVSELKFPSDYKIWSNYK